MSTTFGRVPYVLSWKTAAHEGLRRNQAALTAFSFRYPRAWGQWKDKTHSVNIQQQPKTRFMSSFRATLEMGGKEYDVLYSNYEFKRNTDAKGKPASSVTGGYVSVTVESTEDTTAIEAMLNNQFKTVDGKIVYKKTDEDAKMKEIEFKNAYIVHYKETLDTTNDVPMTIAMTLSAETLTVGNAELDNRWAKV